MDHLFFRCGYSKWIWINIQRKFRISLNGRSLTEIALQILHSFVGELEVKNVLVAVFNLAIWHIWTERNTRKFKEEKKKHKCALMKEMEREICWKLNYLNKTGDSILSDEKMNLRFWIDRSGLVKKHGEIRTCCWDPPNAEILKLNTDGSLTSQGGGCGGIIRNNDGRVMA